MNGQLDQWDRYLFSTQLFYNLKQAEVHGSNPYSLVFARKANAWEDYSNVEEDPLSLDHLKHRLNYMNSLVYPAIVEKSNAVHLKRNEYFKKRHHIIIDQFAPGAVVMVKDETRNDKNTPRYEGPFTIIRRNQGGAYVLKNALDEEFVRPPNVLKLVHHDLKIPGLPGIAAEVDKILDHKEVGEETHYLVHWKKLSSSLDEWVPHSEFNDVGPILLYHKVLAAGKDIHQETAKKKKQHSENKRIRSDKPKEVVSSGRQVDQTKKVRLNTQEVVENNVAAVVPKELRFEAQGSAFIKKSGSGKRRESHVPGAFKK